ncbi:acyl-CoA synthetase (AMP-forming)/AMP-acid ligase II [Paraburkholderia sp. HC6.4b]|uniref:class I adenylate-forming enzyme family protein n=1 Tax=unclassified Paraburkholderia TaxID=2615204 RepID=UPI00161DFE08|nr:MULTISPECIES: AMP-binding protein [unclassified Paraburkholderia]MBB5406342.1 acyl-CoA synthetase (AMP-forming)/AMP-acid ligase II [Paraburkholderia sp. HC6.4b]MBB5448740.1 acyl-CoA synthetase (AMP-forming)/AMP-acid ligase II [Paraburkholderia sp. Kb1A]
MFPINFLRHSALVCPDAVAAIDGDCRLTYKELIDRSDALAAGLQNLAGKTRPTVALLGPNSVEMLVALMAVHACGAILVPLNGRNAPPELDAQIGRAKPDVVVVHRAYLDKFTAGDRHVSVVDAYPGDARAMTLLERKHWGQRAEWSASITDINAIKFTGGSSGVPKGVLQSFRCINALVSAVVMTFELTPNDRYLCAAPMTHGAGAFILPTLSKGGRVVLTSNAAPGQLLDLMQRERVTSTWIPPTLLYKLIDEQKARPRELSRLAHLIWGGAAASPARLREALQVFGPVIETAYGQTEAPLILSAARASDMADERRLTSVGRVAPLVDVTIQDKEGNRLGPNEPGEICARGDLLMSGYLDMPEESAKAIRDGWLRTGDVGLVDEDGFLYIKDRIRDVVISGGFNVYPSDVEAVIAQHPAVSEVVVFGVPDDHWGERVEAALELREGQITTEDELIAFCKERVGSVKTPKHMRIVTSLPRSAVGKVVRREARAMAISGGNA